MMLEWLQEAMEGLRWKTTCYVVPVRYVLALDPGDDYGWAGVVWTQARAVMDWYESTFGVLLPYRIDTMHLGDKTLRQYFHQRGYYVPTCYIVPDETPELAGKAGIAHGEFVLIAESSIGNGGLYAHEWGHYFMLGHAESGFMAPEVDWEWKDLPVTGEQRATVRRWARMWREMRGAL